MPGNSSLEGAPPPRSAFESRNLLVSTIRRLCGSGTSMGRGVDRTLTSVDVFFYGTLLNLAKFVKQRVDLSGISVASSDKQVVCRIPVGQKPLPFLARL